MASLQQYLSGQFHVCFRFGGKRFKRSLKTTNRRRAEAVCTRLDENIQLVETGRLSLPDDVDVATFLLSDGKLDAKPQLKQSIRLGQLWSEYQRLTPEDALETSSLLTAAIHLRHVVRILGSKRVLSELRTSDLQRYVTTRSKEPGLRGTVSATTIRKEVTTLGSLWNWAATQGWVWSPYPRKGLVFPKLEEQPPFQTWKQIERQVARDSLSDGEAAALWDCLYLDQQELERLLAFIKENSRYPNLHAMCVMAAHTGARRSEVCRARVDDFDLDAGTVVIHERKRSRSKRTTRVVPLTAELHTVISQWLAKHPECCWAFPEDPFALNGASRASMMPEKAGRQLSSVLAGTVWKPVRGWHVFRHSFISLCASRGTDQRFIDAWVGHQTDEQRRRYRHLFPDSQRRAIDAVFSSRSSTHRKRGSRSSTPEAPSC